MTVGKSYAPAPRPFRRRSFLKAAASLTLAVAPLGVVAASDQRRRRQGEPKEFKMTDRPATPTTKLTVQRKGQVVLFGLNRPQIHNRVDPETYRALGNAPSQSEHDASLRAAGSCGHGENASQGT